MNIAENVAHVQGQIQVACQRVGRSPDEVLLVAVSKKQPLSYIQQALAVGISHFGENRIEEASEKIPAQAASWHMIGHVQSRKAKDVIQLGFDMIHSLDSFKLAQRYDRLASEQHRQQAVLLEINVSGEDSKSGWLVNDWENDAAQRENLWHDIEELSVLEYLNIDGLMTMAPIADNPEMVRPVFRKLAQLRVALKNDFPSLSLTHLSMGMTDDFEVAIEEGATIVRVGRAIFGERPVI